MGKGIGANAVTLGDIFRAGTRLSMPAYQRSYSWSEAEAGALLADLEDAASEGGVHFIGAIVVVNRPAGNHLEIVDGQQRLTTLTILLAVLRDLESDPARADALHALIADAPQPELGEPGGWRITLNHLDGAFFRAHIQARGKATAADEEPSDSDSQLRIRNTTALFTRELEKLPAEDRRKLVEMVMSRCLLVRVDVADRDIGYKVFRVLNTRGKAPNAHDIVKTELFERANFDVRDADQYALRWSEFEAQLGGKPFDDLLRQIRTLHDRSKSDFLSGFRKSVINGMQPRRFLDDVLPGYVRAYQEITTGHADFGDPSPAIGDYLNRMRALDQLGWRAPALKFLVERRGDPDAVEFFRQLERLGYVSQLIFQGKDQRDKRFRRVCDAISNGRGLFGRSSPLAISTDEARRAHERLLGRFGTFGQRRAMALRLNAALAGGETLPPEADATVEHVLPRNPDASSYWLTVWPDPVRRRELCDTLGNFVLLPHQDNQAADRLDFRAKKKVYFDANGGSHFAMTRDLEHLETWTPEVVRQRTERLAAILMQDWGLPIR